MKIYLFFALLIVGFTLAITAAVRPDVIKQKYEEVKKPLDKYQADKEDELWRMARTQEHAAWMLNHRLPNDCAATNSEVRKLECRSLKDQIEFQFHKSWQSKISQGWHP
ncbi:MAG: hypothetical protein Q7U91_08330 [Sideroxyarcus sp.]|nr:hypothetical protein [Sideroxyarcus sp.]